MRVKGMPILTAVFIALLSSNASIAVAAGGKKKAKGGKAATACVEKGGTWDKKKKKCNMPKTEGAHDESADSYTGDEQAPGPQD